MSAAWKDLERRVCTALGGRRHGNYGDATSDCVGVPFSVEIKRCKRPGPPVYSSWIIQAKAQGRRERRPWLLVVANHNDRQPVVCLDFAQFVEIADAAGVIVTPKEQNATEAVTATGGDHERNRVSASGRPARAGTSRATPRPARRG